MTLLYRIYQLFIALPLIAIATLLTALTTTIGCTIGNGNFLGLLSRNDMGTCGSRPTSFAC